MGKTLNTLLGAVVLTAGVLAPAQGQTFSEKVLYSFTGGSDGGNPARGSGLVRDAAGNLYGTTFFGGSGVSLPICQSTNSPWGCGTVFKVDMTGKETVLYSFTAGAGGAFPISGLVRDASGNLYGTTQQGGTVPCNLGNGGCGIVFKVDTTGNETVLYSFTGGADGAFPYALIQDSAGNLYGTTWWGGDLSGCDGAGCGVVFKVDPVGKETVLYTFTGGVDGGTPACALVQDPAGNLYGTTLGGGAYGEGTVFEVDTTGNETVLHSFTGGADGYYPSTGSLLRDAARNLYGITQSGGDYGQGTVFKVDTAGNETVLYSFTGGADGDGPTGGLIADAAGNLYGTTYWGGTGSCTSPPTSGCGVVFRVDTAQHETVLHSFSGEPDGAYPLAGVIADAAGSLYGTTIGGGASNAGAVFELQAEKASLPPLVRFALKGTSGSFDEGLNPYTAPVISVFDHSMRQDGNYHVYGCDGRVEAFTTEVGTGKAPSPCTGEAPGYPNSTETAFGVNGHYVGDSGDRALATRKLNYDGHPGFDYKAEEGTYVYAVADGEIVYPKFIPGLGHTAPGYHVMGLRPAYAPDLLVCYLHLLKYCDKPGCQKQSYPDPNPAPGCPSSVRIPLDPGTPVKAGCLVALSGDAVPSNATKVRRPHLHLEVEKLLKRLPAQLAASSSFLSCDLGGSSVPCIPVDPYGWAGDSCEQDRYTLDSGVPNTQLWGFQPYLSATALCFGKQGAGTAGVSRSIRLTNVAPTVLRISSIKLEGPNQADFVETNDCATGLLPGGSCTLTVTFSPGVVRASSALLVITGTDGGTPSAVSLTVTLTGTGMLGYR
jgi:uncharacterized repeat protein (TIGR03803 family)